MTSGKHEIGISFHKGTEGAMLIIKEIKIVGSILQNTGAFDCEFCPEVKHYTFSNIGLCKLRDNCIELLYTMWYWFHK